MASGMRTAKVYIQDCFAGILAETEAGYAFAYDDGYMQRDDAVSVSLTMPITKKEYFSETLFPFFDGLIPEGWLLETVHKNWKVDMRDRFGLLLASCRDCIGDVWVEAEVDA